MIPAAELKVRVAIEGIPQGNAKLRAFEGDLKRVSGYDASATLRANVEGRGFEEFDARTSEIRRQAMRPIEQDVRADVDEASFVAAEARLKELKSEAGGFGGVGGPWWLNPGLIAAASPPILQLAGATGALAGSLGEAALGAGALAVGGYGTASVGLAGVVAVAIPAVKSLGELRKAQDAYTKAVATYGQQSPQAETALKKLNAAGKAAGPEATKVAGALGHLKSEWADSTVPGRQDFLGAIGDGLDHLDRKLPLLAGSANRSTSSMRRDFNAFLDEVTGRGAGFDRFINRMTANIDEAGPDVSHALADWVKMFERIGIAVSPDLIHGLDSFADWSDRLLASTDNAGELRRDVHGLVEQTASWVHLLGASGDLLLTLFGAGAGQGQRLVEDTTGKFEGWTRWIEGNRGEVQSFFQDSAEGTEHLLGAASGLAQQWFVVAQALEPVESIVLDVTEALNSVKIGDFSVLTLLLTGGFVAGSAGKALAIFEVLRGYKALQTVLAGQVATTTAVAASEGEAAAAANVQAAANARLAGSIQAVTVANRELLIANASGAVVGTAGGAATAAEGAASGGLLSRIGSRIVGSPFAKAGAVAGGYFAAEFGTKAIEGITGKDFLEDQNLLESLTHGFNTSKQKGAVSEEEGNRKAFDLNPKLDSEKRVALERSFEGLMLDLSVSASAGMGEINKNLSHGLALSSSIWARETPTWRKHTAEAMEKAVDAIRTGMQLGTIPVDQGQREINRLLGQIHLVRGDDPFGLAQATTRSFKQANAITADGVNDWIHKLDKMPHGAREKAIDATTGMLQAWAEGHPKIEREIDALTRYQLRKFGATNKQLREGVQKEATGPVAEAFREAAMGVGGALENIGTNTNQMLKLLGLKGIGEFQALVFGPSRAPQNRGQAAADAHHHPTFHQDGGIIPGVTEGDSVQRMVRPRTFILNREATRSFGFNEGGLVPVVLEPGEREFTPEQVDRIGLDTLLWMNSAVPRFANGGEVDVRGPGVVGQIGHGALKHATDGVNAYLARHRPKGGAGGPSGPAPPGFAALYGMWQPNHPQWDVWQTGLLLQRMGFEVAENPHFGGVHPVHTSGSFHYQDRAIDFNWPGGGGAELSRLRAVEPGLAKLHPKDPLIEDAGSSNQHGHFAFQRGGQAGVREPLRAGSGDGESRSDYVHRIQHLADRAWGALGRSRAPRPRISVKPQSTFTTRWPNLVTVPERYGGSLVATQRISESDWAKRALVHEFAHTMQKWPVFQNVGESEGGASWFADIEAPGVWAKLGYPYTNLSPSYPKYRKQVESEHNRKWAMHGQLRGYQRGGPVLALQNGGSVGNINHVYPEHNSASGDWGGETLPSFVVAALAEAAGDALGVDVPGVTMEQVTRGESGSGSKGSARPGATGVDPGGTKKGLGLWMITTGFNDALIAKYGGQTAMRNPVPNAAAMVAIYGSQGLGAWYGDGSVTGSNLHYTGNYDIRNALGGATFKEALGGKKGGATDTPEPQQVEGKYTKHKAGSTGEGGGTYGQDVRARFHVQTDQLSFGSLPDSVRACTKELNLRRRQLGEYRAAIRHTEDNETRHDLEVNATALERRIDGLRKQRDRLLQQERVKKAVKKISEAAEFKAWTAPGGLFEQRESIFNELGERADQKVSLEPEEQLNLTADWVNSDLKPYVDGVESPAYREVLQAAADWRNTILGAEDFAHTKIQSWEAQVDTLRQNIETIQALKADHPQAWEKRRGELPGMRAKIKALRSSIDNTKTSTLPEWESTLGGVQGLGRTHAILPGLPSEPSDQFGGNIFTTQMTIRELGLKVPNALAGVQGEDPTERLELELELERQANRRHAVEDVLAPVMQQYEATRPMPWMGAFAEGGVALVGERGPELAHFPSGTRVHTATDTERILGNPSDLRVIVNGDIRQEPGDTRDPIEAFMGDRRVKAYIEKTAKEATPIGRITSGGAR